MQIPASRSSNASIRCATSERDNLGSTGAKLAIGYQPSNETQQPSSEDATGIFCVAGRWIVRHNRGALESNSAEDQQELI